MGLYDLKRPNNTWKYSRFPAACKRKIECMASSARKRVFNFLSSIGELWGPYWIPLFLRGCWGDVRPSLTHDPFPITRVDGIKWRERRGLHSSKAKQIFTRQESNRPPRVGTLDCDGYRSRRSCKISIGLLFERDQTRVGCCFLALHASHFNLESRHEGK